MSRRSHTSQTTETSLDTTDKEFIQILGSGSLLFRVKKLARVDLYLLVINLVIGSQFDTEFAGGFWDSVFNFIFTGVGYILLSASMAEMISALPFSGGVFGLVRAFTHPLLGFVIACFELLMSFLYISGNVHVLARIPIEAGHVPEEMKLVVIFLIYVILLVLCIFGGKIYWYTNDLIGVFAVLLITIYVFGSIKYLDFNKYERSSEGFEMSKAMRWMPHVSMMFMGIQLLPLSCKYAVQPQKDVPVVMFSSMMVLVLVAVLVLIIGSFQYPGAAGLDGDMFPLTWGFAHMFKIPYSHAVWLSAPGIFGTCLAYLFCFGRQATTMAGSGLLPAILKKHIPIVHTPWVALIAMVVGSFVLNILLYHYDEHLIVYFDLLCLLASFIVYIGFFIAYFQFKASHSSLQRSFTSPFGQVGAVVGIMIFLVCIAGVVGFQENDYLPAVMLVGFTLAVLLIFMIFLRGTHEFSEEEKEELFKAYLINANKASKDRLRKGKSAATNKSASQQTRIKPRNASSSSHVSSADPAMGSSESYSEGAASSDIPQIFSENLPEDGTENNKEFDSPRALTFLPTMRTQSELQPSERDESEQEQEQERAVLRMEGKDDENRLISVKTITEGLFSAENVSVTNPSIERDSVINNFPSPVQVHRQPNHHQNIQSSTAREENEESSNFWRGSFIVSAFYSMKNNQVKPLT